MGEDASEARLTNSCRLDWWAGTYRPGAADGIRTVLEYYVDAAQQLAGPKCFKEGPGRRFFTNSLYAEDAGILLRWSELSDTINPGLVSIDLQGSFWGQTLAQERKGLLMDAVELPGFRKCTRLDAQRTIVDPMANSEWIWSQVRDRRLWVAGYNGYSALHRHDSKGDALDGASTCWGKPSAAVRCLTYNKALEQRIKDQNVVRHEVRCRSAAAEGYFDALMTALQTEPETTKDSPTTAEHNAVTSILGRHMTYLDTSRYSEIADKKDWPKNWKKQVKPASFMEEVLNGETVDLKQASRFGLKLKERKAHADHQYGSTYGLWVLKELLDRDKELPEVMDELLDHWFIRLKDEHLDELQQITNVQREWLEDYVRRLRKQAAGNLEHCLE